MNFIYCLDKNYNTQAIMSFYTLNKLSNTKVNIYIAHNDPKSLEKVLDQFDFKKLSFNFLEINNNLLLPNLENSHVTEATYYRIFAINLLNEKLDHIVYIDSDILFNKDPVPLFMKFVNNLISSEFIISANTIGDYETNDQETKDYFDYMEMDDKYFNAGVIAYDLNKYRKNNIGEELEEHLINFSKEARYWDQDILNTFFNGKYLELPKSLNNNVVTEDSSILIEEALDNITIHFAGKTKPWHVEGLKYPLGNYFQKKYKEVFKKQYYIKPFDKKRHFKELVDLIKNKNDFLVDNYFKFLIKSLLKLIKL